MYSGIDSTGDDALGASNSPRPVHSMSEGSMTLAGEPLSYRAEMDFRPRGAWASRWFGVGGALRGRDGAYPKLARIRRCSVVADLADFLLQDVAVAYWSRPTQSAIDTYLEAILCRGALGSGGRWILDVEGEHAFPELPDLPGKEALCHDMGYLGRLCADLVGCARLGVRIEILDRAMCPRFHVDRVGLRLLCTYLGPGTEYLDSPNLVPDDGVAEASRSVETLPELGRGARIVRFPRAAVVLLKGDAWPGNEGRGAVHRSPAVRSHDAKRVLLAIDPLE